MHSYFLHTETGQAGPFNIDVLKTKNITKETMVWRAGFKDWMKAGEVEELNILFMEMPPPVKKEEVKPAEKFSIQKVLKNKNAKWIAAALAIGVVVILILFFRDDDKPKNLVLAETDTVVNTPIDTEVKKDTANTDTNQLNLDSLSLVVDWDTTSNNDTTANTGTEVTMPGMGAGDNEEKNKKKTTKKTTTTVKKNTDKDNISPTKKVNPVSFLTITGNFRKNLLLEAVMEGNIHNRHGSTSFRNINIDVLFYDANGKQIDVKTFLHKNLINAGETATFKFKSNAPKGAKTVKYRIKSAATK